MDHDSKLEREELLQLCQQVGEGLAIGAQAASLVTSMNDSEEAKAATRAVLNLEPNGAHLTLDDVRRGAAKFGHEESQVWIRQQARQRAVDAARLLPSDRPPLGVEFVCLPCKKSYFFGARSEALGLKCDCGAKLLETRELVKRTNAKLRTMQERVQRAQGVVLSPGNNRAARRRAAAQARRKDKKP